MATYTEHYGLHQWEPTDDFLRTDFNTDFGKIDAAIKKTEDGVTRLDTQKADRASLEEKCGLVMGSYTGNGTADREISLGFKAKAIFLREDSGEGILCFAGVGFPLRSRNGSRLMLDITERGFRVTYERYEVAGSHYDYTPLTNREGDTYCYAAFR